MKKIIINICYAIIGGLVVALGNFFFQQKTVIVSAPSTDNSPRVDFVRTMLTTGSSDIDFSFAAEKSVGAVVHVKTTYQVEAYDNPWIDFFFGYKSFTPAPVEGFGSGVVISTDGYVVTNNHVIENSDYIEVVLNDKHQYKAKLIGRDVNTDIALLKIDGENFQTIPYGDSDDLKIGQWVLAVGNPFNLTSTVTAGIVSAKGRNINVLDKKTAIESFIQTDAAVNPGNSGGALVTTDGKLIGINTAIATKTGYFTGYSFAIPVNMVKKIVADIIEFGEVQRAYMGVQTVDIDPQLAQTLNLKQLQGVYVQNIEKGGAAEEAGLNIKDVIVKIGEIKINSVTEMQEQLSKYRPGDKIKLTVLRNNKESEFEMTLRNKYGTTQIIKSTSISILGAKFAEISERDKRILGIDYGMKVAELTAGKLLKAGVKESFIILRINRQTVRNFDDIQKAIESAQGGVYIEGVYPNGVLAYYAFGLK